MFGAVRTGIRVYSARIRESRPRFLAQTQSFYCLANSSAEQDELAQLMADGKLKLPIEDSFDFSEAGVHALFAKQDGGKSVGKNVLLFK